MTAIIIRLRRLRHTNTWIYGTMLVSACLSLTASKRSSIEDWPIALRD